MKNKNAITITQIASITMLSSRKVQRIIKDLSAQGKISRSGTKGGHWVIKQIFARDQERSKRIMKYEIVTFVNDEVRLDVNVSPSEDTV